MSSGTPIKNKLRDLRAPHERLTATQYHVVHGIVRGERNSAIGRYLSIHRATVRRHELRILKAMGIKTRGGIISYAVKNGVFGVKKSTYYC